MPKLVSTTVWLLAAAGPATTAEAQPLAGAARTMSPPPTAAQADAAPQHDEAAHARFAAAESALRSGDLERARTEVEAGLAADPLHPEPWAWLGDVRARAGDPEGALEAFRESLELEDTQPWVWLAFGTVLAETGRAAEAVTALERAAALAPDEPEPAFRLGVLWLQLARPDEASAPLRRAAALDPESAAARHALGAALLESGRPDEALAALDEATRLAPADPDVAVDQARALAIDQPAAALARLQALVEAHPDLAAGWRALGSLLATSSDPMTVAAAPAALRTAVRLQPDDLATRMDLVDAYWGLGLYEDVREQIEEILADHPDFAGAWLDLGNYFLYRERFEEAADTFARAAEIEPEWADAHARRGSALASALQYARAIDAFEEALRIDPAQLDVRVALATSALAVDDPDRALTELRHVPEDRLSPAASRMIGEALLRKEQPEEAVAPLRRAVQLDPDDREAWRALAQALRETGSPESVSARGRAEALSRAEPEVRRREIEQAVADRHEMHLVQARAYLLEGRPAPALELLARAREYRADDPRVVDLTTQARALDGGDREPVSSEARADPEGADPQGAGADSDTRGDRAAAAPAVAAAASTPDSDAPDADRAVVGPFVDVAAAVGLDAVNVNGHPEKRFIVEGTGSGAAWIDFDRDGRLDAFLPNGNAVRYVPLGNGGTTIEVTDTPPDVLARQDPEGGFRDVAALAGVDGRLWAGGAAEGDVDNDGWPDLYVTHRGENRLYRNNGDGTFSDVTTSVNAGDGRWSSTAAFADLDADGALDLYVTSYVVFDPAAPPFEGKTLCSFNGVPGMCGPAGLEGVSDLLLWGGASGAFERQDLGEITDARFYGLGVVPIDVDDDQDLDLYVANDMTPNLLLLNNGGRELEEAGLLYGVAYSGDGRVQAGMGIAAGDIEGDGFDDLVVTNFSHDFNTVYGNLGGSAFRDITRQVGLASSSFPYLGWSTHLRDFDLDGDADLFVTNGHIYPAVDGMDVGTTYRQRNQLFRNDEGVFVEVGGGPGLEVVESSRCAVVGDFDGDGDEDVLVTNNDRPPTLLRNDRSAGRSLQLRLIGTESNRSAIGARVVIRDGGRMVQRTVTTAGGYLGSQDATLTIGLSSNSAAVEIRWPSGAVERLPDVAAGQIVVLREGIGIVAARPFRQP